MFHLNDFSYIFYDLFKNSHYYYYQLCQLLINIIEIMPLIILCYTTSLKSYKNNRSSTIHFHNLFYSISCLWSLSNANRWLCVMNKSLLTRETNKRLRWGTYIITQHLYANDYWNVCHYVNDTFWRNISYRH